MDPDVEFSARSDAAGYFVRRVAAKWSAATHVASLGRECRHIKTQQLFECGLKLLDLGIELEPQAGLCLSVEIAVVYLIAEVQCLAVDGGQFVRGVFSGLAKPCDLKLAQASFDLFQTRGEPIRRFAASQSGQAGNACIDVDLAVAEEVNVCLRQWIRLGAG